SSTRYISLDYTNHDLATCTIPPIPIAKIFHDLIGDFFHFNLGHAFSEIEGHRLSLALQLFQRIAPPWERTELEQQPVIPHRSETCSVHNRLQSAFAPAAPASLGLMNS